MLKHHVPLKPISLRREKLSWDSPRTGPLTTKGGSEESGTSSSSQSSMDLEDRDEKDGMAIQETNLKDMSPEKSDSVKELHFKVQSRVGRLLRNRSAHNLDSKPIIHVSDQDDTMNHIKDSVNKDMFIMTESNEENTTVGGTTEPHTDIIYGTFNMKHNQGTCSEENYSKQLPQVKQTEEALREIQVNTDILGNAEEVQINTCTGMVETLLFTSPGNLQLSDVDPKKDEKMVKASKPARIKERRASVNCEIISNNQINQSFNILAHKDQSIISQNKSKSNMKYSSLSTQVKEKTRKSPELRVTTLTKVKSRLRPVKGVPCNTGTSSPRKKTTEPPQNKRANPEKLESSRAPQHTPGREMKSAQQVKRLTVIGTPRSKSAVDFLTYKDMFQQIHSGDEGPAIYEMFAGPIYDNLRVSSSCENTDRQGQSAGSRKTQQPHKAKRRQLKQPQCKLRRSQGEAMAGSAKNKSKSTSPRAKPHLTRVSKKGTLKTDSMAEQDPELALSKRNEISHNSSEEKPDDHKLSTIQEVLSRYGSETVKSKDRTPTQTPSSHAEDHNHMNIQKTTGNSSTGNPNRPVSEPVSPPSPQQLKINTWTSSGSSHTTVSPVYQRFLDDVGGGALTDDLLQCLAEELISLDERDATVGPCSENTDPSKVHGSQREECSGKDAVTEVSFHLNYSSRQIGWGFLGETS